MDACTHQRERVERDIVSRVLSIDAVTARWTTKDPWGFGGGELNLYRHAEGNADLANEHSLNLSFTSASDLVAAVSGWR